MEKQVFEFFVCSWCGTYSSNSLCVLIWNFYQMFLIVCTELWLRLEPQFRPTRFAINFLFIIVRAERKVRFCVKLFYIFSNWILIRLSWNLSRLVPNSVGIFTQKNQQETVSGKIFRNFLNSKTILFPDL